MADKVNLFLDDCRNPPDDSWTTVRTVWDAQLYFASGRVAQSSLDHDLGACADCMGGKSWEWWLLESGGQSMPHCPHVGTGYDLICWMERTGCWPEERPAVHSANPVGRARMNAALDRHYGAHKTGPHRLNDGP